MSNDEKQLRTKILKIGLEGLPKAEALQFLVQVAGMSNSDAHRFLDSPSDFDRKPREKTVTDDERLVKDLELHMENHCEFYDRTSDVVTLPTHEEPVRLRVVLVPFERAFITFNE